MLTTGVLLTVLDSIAAGVGMFITALGDADTPGTIAAGAAENRDELATIDDATVQADLLHTFSRRVSLVRASAIYSVLQGAIIQRALDRHYGNAGAGNLNRLLTNEGVRVHPYLRLIGMQIDARNVFVPQVVDPVASYEGTGTGTGLFAAGSDINPSEYFAPVLELVVEAMGGSDRTLRLTLQEYDGTWVERTVIVPGDALADETIAIGDPGEHFRSVSNIITLDGGTDLDRVRVRSVVERTIAL